MRRDIDAIEREPTEVSEQLQDLIEETRHSIGLLISKQSYEECQILDDTLRQLAVAVIGESEERIHTRVSEAIRQTFSREVTTAIDQAREGIGDHEGEPTW